MPLEGHRSHSKAIKTLDLGGVAWRSAWRENGLHGPDNLVPAHQRCHQDWHRNPYVVIPFNNEKLAKDFGYDC